MKSTFAALLCAASLAAGVSLEPVANPTSSAAAATPVAPAPQSDQLPPEVLARITPGPEHAQMARYLGKWDVELRMTMKGMEGMPVEKATCTYEWLIEGRWMLSRMKGSMMGTPAEWAHVHGYNNMTKSFETVGFDSMSTDTKISYGNAVTPDGKTMGFQGFMNEWLTGQIQKPFRTVQKPGAGEGFHLEIWDPEIGPTGMEVMRMTFTRAR